MSLVRTVPNVSAGDEPSADLHRQMLLAADELLEARFNNRTWLVFGCAPQLELGDLCIFGTPENLSVTGSAYDVADESPADPSSGSVVSLDLSTRVIWLTGYADTTTLNRRKVTYNPGTGAVEWWVGTVRPQRWEPLRIADLCVEDFTDPVAGVDTVFTWRSHWDKHGCIRIHNGNRFALTLQFEGATQSSVEIPPYGILCGRREAHDAPFEWESSYLPLTREGDPMTWAKRHTGQFAGSMEMVAWLVESLSGWTRMVPAIDCDSTARERASFTGASPAGSDALWDWLWHRGRLLSVVLDRRDGTTTIQELNWGGLAGLPDATWAGHVQAEINMFGALEFASLVTAPSGASDEEWEHDLIPITTNVTGGAILALKDGPVAPAPILSGWGHYTQPTDLANFGSSTLTVRSTESGGATTVAVSLRDLVPVGSSSLISASVDAFVPAPASGTTGLSKTFGAIGRWGVLSASASDSICELSDTMLRRVRTSGSLMEWTTARHSALSGRRRFLPRQPRKGHHAGADVGGAAVFDSHPQDGAVLGTPDGLGGAMSVVPKPLFQSPIAIEGAPWTRTESDRGTTLWIPADMLHPVARYIRVPGWWATNRDRVVAGTLEAADQLYAWREPRDIDEWNAIATAINHVMEVHRADIRHLHKDPLPDDVDHPPFSYAGEQPHSVPADWICGRYDGDGTLFDWATLWGVTPIVGLPDLDALADIDRKVWSARANEDGDVCVLEKILESDYDLVDHLETVNGYTFHSYKALDKTRCRHLFGGAGDWSEYVYLTGTLTKVVFDPLGIHVPPPPAGERFSPVIEEDSGVTAVNGALAGGEPDPLADPIIEAQAQQAYRSPDPDGTWLQVFDGELAGITHPGFRVTGAFGSEKFLIAWRNPGAAEYTGFERNTSAACVDNGGVAPRSKTLFTSAQSHLSQDAYAAIEDNAWRSGTEVYSTVPFLLVGAPEFWCEFQWDTIDWTWSPGGTFPEQQYSIQEHPPVSGGLKHREYDAGSVTADTMIADGWTAHGAYHCQVVQRPGVLRV